MSITQTLVNEKNVMEKMCHPFIMKFYRSFKDAKNIYFVTEYIPGDMLFNVIRTLEEVSSDETRFYVAQMVLVLP